MTYDVQGYVCRYHITDDGNDILMPSLIGGVGEYNAQNIKMLYQHDIHRPIGVWHSLTSDDIGLYGYGMIYETVIDGLNTANMIRGKLIDGFSIGFIPKRYFIRSDGVRVIERINLREISIVTFPMQTDARIMYGAGEYNDALDILLMRLTGVNN